MRRGAEVHVYRVATPPTKRIGDLGSMVRKVPTTLRGVAQVPFGSKSSFCSPPNLQALSKPASSTESAAIIIEPERQCPSPEASSRYPLPRQAEYEIMLDSMAMAIRDYR